LGEPVALSVIAGLDPAIHHSKRCLAKMMDARIKPAHDDGGELPSYEA
jgi:hypothetical protein